MLQKNCLSISPQDPEGWPRGEIGILALARERDFIHNI